MDSFGDLDDDPVHSTPPSSGEVPSGLVLVLVEGSHCMLPGVSEPPLLRGTMWSTSQRSQPGGLGVVRLKSERAEGSRLIRPLLSRAQYSHFVEER
jgi:hypothetical protein